MRHFGLGHRVVDGALGMVDLERTVRAAAVETESGGNGAVGAEFIAFDGVVGVLFNEGGNVGDDLRYRP